METLRHQLLWERSSLLNFVVFTQVRVTPNVLNAHLRSLHSKQLTVGTLDRASHRRVTWLCGFDFKWSLSCKMGIAFAHKRQQYNRATISKEYLTLFNSSPGDYLTTWTKYRFIKIHPRISSIRTSGFFVRNGAKKDQRGSPIQQSVGDSSVRFIMHIHYFQIEEQPMMNIMPIYWSCEWKLEEE